jgi:hypothetical protein
MGKEANNEANNEANSEINGEINSEINSEAKRAANRERNTPHSARARVGQCTTVLANRSVRCAKRRPAQSHSWCTTGLCPAPLNVLSMDPLFCGSAPVSGGKVVLLRDDQIDQTWNRVTVRASTCGSIQGSIQGSPKFDPLVERRAYLG